MSVTKLSPRSVSQATSRVDVNQSAVPLRGAGASNRLCSQLTQLIVTPALAIHKAIERWGLAHTCLTVFDRGVIRIAVNRNTRIEDIIQHFLLSSNYNYAQDDKIIKGTSTLFMNV